MTDSRKKEKATGNTVMTNSGHRGRLRRRFLDNGLGALLDHEALELLLTYAIPRRDVKPLAKTLLGRFGSFESVFDATEYELSEIPGVGENAASLILLCKAVCARYLAQHVKELESFDSLESVADFARMKIGGGGKETVMVMFFNSRKRLLQYRCFPGTVDRTILFPREVIELCLKFKASAFILIHSHPSGLCLPSDDDIALTAKLKIAADTHDIMLIDHLIVSPASFYSMKSGNFLI